MIFSTGLLLLTSRPHRPILVASNCGRITYPTLCSSHYQQPTTVTRESHTPQASFHHVLCYSNHHPAESSKHTITPSFMTMHSSSIQRSRPLLQASTWTHLCYSCSDRRVFARLRACCFSMAWITNLGISASWQMTSSSLSRSASVDSLSPGRVRRVGAGWEGLLCMLM
jgi:hypothetical protein